MIVGSTGVRAKTTVGDLHLPFEGEIIRSENRRYAETIVFVHHFGGSKRTLCRHLKMVNELGYDAVVFNLLYHDSKTPLKALPITGHLKFGARHVWADQIEGILNSVPGKKIIYSFSMPSNAVVDAIARRKAEDIAAWVCDGGPFLQLYDCVWNLYTHQHGIPSKLFRAAFTLLSIALMGSGLIASLNGWFEKFPRDFPVLSIRSGNDPLVPESAIDEFFAHARTLALKKVTIAEATHLEGYKINAIAYRAKVKEFLAQASQIVA